MGKAELKLEIDADLLAQAQEAGLSIGAVTEAGLRIALADPADRPPGILAAYLRQVADPKGAEDRARQWTEENAEAIAEYNRRVKEHGLFGDEFRKW